jgi:hypothetical protein
LIGQSKKNKLLEQYLLIEWCTITAKYSRREASLHHFIRMGERLLMLHLSRTSHLTNLLKLLSQYLIKTEELILQGQRIPRWDKPGIYLQLLLLFLMSARKPLTLIIRLSFKSQWERAGIASSMAPLVPLWQLNTHSLNKITLRSYILLALSLKD